MFNRLGEVEIGDIIGFQAMSGQEMSFEIFEVSVIVPDDQIAFVQPQSESIITLYTCTPIREATHRLIVRARIIEGGLF
jgi:sortase A